MAKVEIKYTCDCCGGEFPSGRVRSGDKLCAECIGLRRTLKSYINHGLSIDEVLQRSAKLLNK